MKSEIIKNFDIFNVRIVQKNEKYGLNDCLIHEKEDLLIEFYDNRFHNSEDWEKRGQFISRYYAKTLIEDCTKQYCHGLHLDSSVPDWFVKPEIIAEIYRWLRTHIPSFRPNAKQLSDMNFFRDYMYRLEADPIENALARATIRTAKREGGGKCFLGKYNQDSKKSIGLVEYSRGKIYNFSYDFVLTRWDETINQKLIQYNKTGDFKIIMNIVKRVQIVNGYQLFWS